MTLAEAQGASGVEEVVASLSRLRVQVVGREHDLHALIAWRFDEDGIKYHREFQLARGSRIDFLTSKGVGVEVKKGKPAAAAVEAQVARYCAATRVAAVVLVVERNLQYAPSEAHGKPVRYVSLSKLWGIAL